MEETRLPDSPQFPAHSFHIPNYKRQTEKSLCEEKKVIDTGNDTKDEFVLSPSIVEQNHDNDLSRLDESVPKEDCINSDFIDPGSMSMTDGEDNDGVENSSNTNTTVTQFFDAWEGLSEVSWDGGTRISLPDAETEIREMRLNLSSTIEKRKQCEEALIKMENQWRKMARCLSDVGFTVPPEVLTVPEGEQSEIAEGLLQQVYISRFVSETIGKEAGKAEMEMEMESRLQLKNFEIARLCDRLKYYEAMNREMSHMNQETIVLGRHERKRRQKWVWGFVASAMAIGAVGLACSYLPSATHLQYEQKDSVPK